MNHYQLFSKCLDTLLQKFMAFGTKPIVRTHKKIGRNKPCPCGSGVKYKKCHYSEDYQKGNV